MATHYMHLSDEPFEWIKSGKQSVELRLFDEKRKKINIDDIIIFTKLSSDDKIKVKVKGLARFSTFKDAFMFIPKTYLAHDNLTLEEQIDRMRRYYPKDKEEKYGLLAIWFEVLE